MTRKYNKIIGTNFKSLKIDKSIKKNGEIFKKKYKIK